MFLDIPRDAAAAPAPVIPPFLRSEIIPEDGTRWKSTRGGGSRSLKVIYES